MLLLAPEAAGSEPPTHLGATDHSRHAAGQCARCECSVWKVGDGWSRLGFHLAVGGRGTASSRAGVRTWRLGCARRARVACRAGANARKLSGPGQLKAIGGPRWAFKNDRSCKNDRSSKNDRSGKNDLPRLALSGREKVAR